MDNRRNTSKRGLILLLIILMISSCSLDKKYDEHFYGMFNGIMLYDFASFNPATANPNSLYDYHEWNDMVYTPQDLDTFFLSISNYMFHWYERDLNYNTGYDVHITYKSDDGYDYAKSPRTTMFDRYGDCEDIALVFMNLAYTVSRGVVKMDLVLVEGVGTVRTVVDGGTPNHTQVSYRGIVYEAQSGKPMYNNIMYKYSFTEIFGR